VVGDEWKDVKSRRLLPLIRANPEWCHPGRIFFSVNAFFLALLLLSGGGVAQERHRLMTGSSGGYIPEPMRYSYTISDRISRK